MTQMLEIKNLSKSFSGNNVVLDSVSLSIAKGSFVGLFGLNGAGKSTFLNILTRNIKPDTGSVKINGFDISKNHLEAALSLGIMQQEPDVEMRTTALDILTIHAGLYGISYKESLKRAKELLTRLGLGDKMHVQARNMSGGMIQRLKLSKALISRPQLLILDEPTAGVDIQNSKKVWECVDEAHKNGTTIILTTHVIDDLAKLCNRLIFLKKGQFKFMGKEDWQDGYQVEFEEGQDLSQFKKDNSITLLEDGTAIFQMEFDEAISCIKQGGLKSKNIKALSGIEATILKNI